MPEFALSQKESSQFWLALALSCRDCSNYAYFDGQFIYFWFDGYACALISIFSVIFTLYCALGCRISPPRFLTECHKRRQNPGSCCFSCIYFVLKVVIFPMLFMVF